MREAYSPIPVNMPFLKSSAVKKLKYVQEPLVFTQADKEAQLGNENFIINICVFQKIFNEMTKCSACHRGNIKIVQRFESGLRTLHCYGL